MYVCTYVCIYVYAQFACMYVYSILEVLGIVLGIGSMYVYLCLYVCMLAIYRYVVLIHSINAAFQIFAMCQAFSFLKLHFLGS
jgi:hypothetical protein